MVHEKPFADVPLNQVQPRRSLYDMAHLARLELESCILKLFLHISSSEISEIAHLPCAATVRLADGHIPQCSLTTSDALLMPEENAHCFILCSCDLGLQ